MFDKINIFIFILISTFSMHGKSRNLTIIQGQIVLNESWESKIYLSFIDSFEKLYAISNEMIIANSEIDKNGNFCF